jgi:Zn-dependent protease
MVSFSGSLLAVALSIGFILLWSLTRQLLKQRIGLGRVDHKRLDELPPHLAAAFAETVNRLRDLGFREEDCHLTQPMFGTTTATVWALNCVNRQDRVLATVSASTRAGSELCSVRFCSWDRSNSQFVSFNFQAHLYIPGMPGWSFHDTGTTDLNEALQSHLLNRTKTIPDPVIPDSATRMSEAEDFFKRYLHFLLDDRWIKPAPNGEYRFGFFAAVRMALRVLGGEIRYKIHRPKTSGGPPPSKASPELELDLYKRFEAQLADSRPVHWAIKFGVFIGSAIAFCAVLGLLSMASAMTVVFFALAIFFHELGHLAGMRFFGYRDTQIFFVPAFGAMTTGIKTDAPPFQRMIVSFLGPMPGLILSIALFLTMDADTDSWLFQLLAIVFTINYLNLLPILPLDGGVIADTVISSRLPHSTSVLSGISAVLLGGAGIYFSEPALLVIAIVLLMIVRSQWVSATAEKALRTDIGTEGLNGEPLVHRIFLELGKPPYARLSFARKVQLARKLVNQAGTPAATLMLSCVCLALQFGMLAIPLLAFLYSRR